MTEVTHRTRRDPGRRARILDAAAELFADRGYRAVGMVDIGVAAGIVGSGVYRHFASKSALLSALLNDVMDDLFRDAAAIVDAGRDDREVLSTLVSNHVRVTMEHRRVLTVYFREAPSLPAADHRRLRRAQRHYVEEWVAVLAVLRRDLADADLRLTVHAALGAIQSVLFHDNGLPEARMRELVGATAQRCLGLGPGWSSPAGGHRSTTPLSES
jgi:AcrR family transcriptional regulator